MSFLFKRKAVSTSLKVSPPFFQVESGKSIMLRVEISPPKAPIEAVEWRLEGVGALSAQKGASILYVAPKVEAETRVRIVALFPKSSEYLDNICYAEGLVLPAGRAARAATFLMPSPPSFSIECGEKIDLNVRVADFSGKILEGKKIKWSIQPEYGTIKASDGTAVYETPKVDAETHLTITATFEGDEEHLGGETTILGLVSPPTPAGEYILRFGKAEATEVRIEGPVDTFGLIKIEIGKLDISDLRISRVNLSAKTALIKNIEIHATRFKAITPESKECLDVKSGDEIRLEAAEASFDDGLIYFTSLSCAEGELNSVDVTSRHVGGIEPYLPLLLTTSNITMDRGFSVTGPESYGRLEGKATKILCGRITASNFSLTCPSSYTLDREENKHEFTEKWGMRAVSASIEKAEIYAVYFKVRALLVWRVRATGEEYIPSIIPEGLHRGEKAPINEADVDVIHLRADRLRVDKAAFTVK